MNFRKLNVGIQNDRKFKGLPDDCKLLFYTIYFHPNLTSLGAMRISVKGLAEEIGWPYERLKRALNILSGIEKIRAPSQSSFDNFGEDPPVERDDESLSGLLMIRFDENNFYLEITNYLIYNKPENLNIISSWRKAFDSIPECRLKFELFARMKAVCERSIRAKNRLEEKFGDLKYFRIDRYLGTIGPPLPEDKRRKEPKEEKTLSSFVGSELKTREEIEKIFKKAQDLLPIKPISKSQNRIAKIKARMRTFSADQIMIAIENVSRDSFMCGDNDRGTAYATIDYIVRSDENVEKWLKKKGGNGNGSREAEARFEEVTRRIPDEEMADPSEIRKIVTGFTGSMKGVQR